MLQIVLAIAIVFAVAALALARRQLTQGGALAAVVVGTVVVIGGQIAGAAILLTFFVTATALGRWRRAAKSGMDFEKPGARDARQVFANGGLGAVVLLFAVLLPVAYHALLFAAYAAAIAEANADTWATEVGAAVGGAAWLISTGKRVAPGRSGGVSIAGTTAAFAGAALIGAIAGCVWSWDIVQILVVTLCGFLGSLVDSVLGATLQRRYHRSDGTLGERGDALTPVAGGLAWMDNDAVNFLGTLFSSSLALILLRILHHSTL